MISKGEKGSVPPHLHLPRRWTLTGEEPDESAWNSSAQLLSTSGREEIFLNYGKFEPDHLEIEAS